MIFFHLIFPCANIFFLYSCGNAKNIIYFDQRRVKVKIWAISFFPSAAVLERESSESWWISTLFLACEIDGGAWNGFLRFSRKRTDLSKKKLHSVCILTKVYQSAKEERFWFFEPCHESAILVDFCTDSLIIPQKRQVLHYKYSKTPHWRFQKKAKS